MLSKMGIEQYDSPEDGKGVTKPGTWSSLECEEAGVGNRVKMQDGFKGVLQVNKGSYIGGS